MLSLLFDFFSGKAKTRIYTTFLGWVLVLHIDILFIAIFTDQAILFEKTKLLKGEYIWSYATYFGWWAIAIETVRIALAAGVTYLMIWIVPKLVNERSYKEELRVEYILRKMKVDKEEALNKREEDVAKQQLKNIETEKKVVTERAKLENTPEEVKWDMDYEVFKSTADAYNFFGKIIKIVYEYGGNLNRASFSLPNSNIMAYYDTHEIISFNQSMISLTTKGRYFVRKYTSKS